MRLVSDWDDQVPDELVKEWYKATQKLSNVASLSLLRRRAPMDGSRDSKFEYHVFTNSSKDIAAAAVYL